MDDDRSAASRCAADLRRTVDRVGGLGLPRLAAEFAPEPTRADAVHALAQRLADIAADLEGRPRRPVPRLADQAVGDQLAVCGHDLLAAAGDDHDALLTAIAADLLDLRRRL